MDALSVVALGMAKKALDKPIPEPTTVVANPVLVGDEDALTGIEINGVKYKIPVASGFDTKLRANDVNYIAEEVV